MTGRKIQALFWEEGRTGGVIAGWMFLLAVLALGWASLTGNRQAIAMGNYADLAHGTLLVTVVALSLLLIVSVDYAGHVRAGFSRRVLHLPVHTYQAVAVALITRTLLAFTVGVGLWAVGAFLLQAPGGWGLILFAVFLYLAAQLVDWLREPVSGLSSLLLLAAVALLVHFLGNTGDYGDFFGALAGFGAEPIAAGLALFVPALAVTYGVGVWAVDATRAGRRYGVPEVWQWPRYVSLGPGRTRPFASPLTAQIWHDARRFGWVMPVATVAIMALGMTVVWMNLAPKEPGARILFTNLLALAAGGSLPLAAMAQSLMSAPRGLRRRKGRASFTHLLPLPAAELARARTIVHAISFALSLAIVCVVYYGFIEGPFVFGVMTEAVAIGGFTPHEFAWALLGRVLLVGGAAWLLFGGRYLALIFGAWVLLAVVLVPFAATGTLSESTVSTSLGLSMVLLMLGVIGVGYGRAYANGIVPLRALLSWGALWLLAAALLLGRIAPGVDGGSTAWGDALLTCLAIAAAVPLPYLGALTALHRARHSASPPQDPAQHGRGVRLGAWAGVGIAAVAVLWLVWPHEPGYISLWHERGWPATLEELDEWYPWVPDDENAALAYIAIEDDNKALQSAFFGVDLTADDQARSAEYLDKIDRLPILGNYELERAAPIPPAVWDTMNAYREQVTREVAASLEAAAARDYAGSRYPVDLTEGWPGSVPHLTPARRLARPLNFSALCASVRGDGADAVDAVTAIFPLANSLEKEPILISQLERVGVLSIAVEAAEESVLNRTVLDDADLARLQAAFANALPPYSEERFLDRAFVGESLTGIDTTLPGSPTFAALSDAGPFNSSAFTLLGIGTVRESERAAMVAFCNELITDAPRRYPEWEQRNKTLEALSETYGTMGMLARILLPALGRSREAELRVRTWLDIAVTAIAVERYRVASGRLPESLDGLVPAYLEAVPEDPYAPAPQPLSYRVRPDGEWVVYSYHRDMKDDGGVEIERWYKDGDLTFTVAPLAVRTGPHIREPEVPEEPQPPEESADFDPFRVRTPPRSPGDS